MRLKRDDYAMVGVCGFGRCGSTVAMRMLDAGGLPPVAGSARGSYELEGLHEGAFDVTPGRSVKLLDAVLWCPVPVSSVPWRFVWLDRDPVQQAKSQVKFMSAILGGDLADDAEERLIASYAADRPKAIAHLLRLGSVVTLSFEEILADPWAAADRLRQVWPALDVRRAAAVVHVRAPSCRPDLAVELAAATADNPGQTAGGP